MCSYLLSKMSVRSELGGGGGDTNVGFEVLAAVLLQIGLSCVAVLSWGARNGIPSTVLSGRKVRLAARFRVFLYPAAGTVKLLRIIRALPTVHTASQSSTKCVPTFRALQYTHNRCNEFPATCFGTPLVPSSGSLPSSYSSAI